jgi:transposase-like protein
MSENIKVRKAKKKIKLKFPRYSAIDTFEIVKKAVKDYGDRIMPYDDFAHSIGLEEPAGGTYSMKIEALKLYDLMDRVSYKEIGATMNGRRILDASPSDQKKLLFESTLRIDMFNDLFQRFPQLPTKRKAITNYLIGKGFDSSIVGRIASVFVKNHKEFASLIASGELFKPQEPIPKATTPEGVDQSLVNFFYLFGSLYPSTEAKNLKQTLTTLSDISKSKNWRATSALIESLNAIYSDEKDTNKLKEGLEKAKRLVFRKLEEDLEVKLDENIRIFSAGVKKAPS